AIIVGVVDHSYLITLLRLWLTMSSYPPTMLAVLVMRRAFAGGGADLTSVRSAVRPLAPPVYPVGYLRRVDHVGGPTVRGCDDLTSWLDATWSSCSYRVRATRVSLFNGLRDFNIAAYFIRVISTRGSKISPYLLLLRRVKNVHFWHDSLEGRESSYSSPTRSRFWLARVAKAWIGTFRSPHRFLSPPFPTRFLGSLSVLVLAP
ncbi:hypothetical protein BHM03_00054329, partial [Ensete ventricosum]